jgi:hypothetical protein
MTQQNKTLFCVDTDWVQMVIEDKHKNLSPQQQAEAIRFCMEHHNHMFDDVAQAISKLVNEWVGWQNMR